MERRKSYYIGVMFSAVLMAGMMAGCTERDLSERPSDGMLRIEFEWPKDDNNNTVDVSGAHLWLYGSDGSLYLSTPADAGGYEARVPADTYTAIVINSDNVNTESHDEDAYSTCRVEADLLENYTDVLMNVDHVFCTGIGGITVNRGNLPTVVTMYPENVVKYIHFRIDPTYIDDVESMEIRMSGIVPAVYTRDGNDTEEQTLSVMAAAQSESNGLYSADMSVFGWRGNNIITATVRFTDGTEEETLPVDISDQLDDLPEEGGTVDVILQLPDGGEIRLTATVDTWGSGSGSGIVI